MECVVHVLGTMNHPQLFWCLLEKYYFHITTVHLLMRLKNKTKQKIQKKSTLFWQFYLRFADFMYWMYKNNFLKNNAPGVHFGNKHLYESFRHTETKIFHWMINTKFALYQVWLSQYAYIYICTFKLRYRNFLQNQECQWTKYQTFNFLLLTNWFLLCGSPFLYSNCGYFLLPTCKDQEIIQKKS